MVASTVNHTEERKFAVGSAAAGPGYVTHFVLSRRPGQRNEAYSSAALRRLRSPGSAALRAATLARICRVEGGYARPDLPR